MKYYKIIIGIIFVLICIIFVNWLTKGICTDPSNSVAITSDNIKLIEVCDKFCYNIINNPKKGDTFQANNKDEIRVYYEDNLNVKSYIMKCEPIGIE